MENVSTLPPGEVDREIVIERIIDPTYMAICKVTALHLRWDVSRLSGEVQVISQRTDRDIQRSIYRVDML